MGEGVGVYLVQRVAMVAAWSHRYQSAMGNAKRAQVSPQDFKPTINKASARDSPVHVELAEVLHRGLELEFVHDLVDHLQRRPDAKPREGGGRGERDAKGKH